MPVKVSICNKKGGVGKTTTAVNLAASLSELGKKVLLIDLDGQRNTTTWCLGIGASDPETDILGALLSGTDPTSLVVPSHIPGVDIIPASEALLDAEARVTKITQVTLLQKSMVSWPDRWDFVVFDCPPDMKSITSAALIASTDAIIVSKPGTMDLTGIASVIHDIYELRDALNPGLRVSGVLLTQADPRTLPTKGAIDNLEEGLPGLLYGTVIRTNVRFLEAHGWGKSILDYAPNSTGAADYRAFAKEFLERCGGK